jgi:hypothetical protein
MELELEAGARLEVALPARHTAALFVLAGRACVNASRPAGEAELVLLDIEGEGIELRAEAPTRALLLGGAPLGEPVVAHGPFVMTTRAEILQAIEDYQSGRMGRLEPH